MSQTPGPDRVREIADKMAEYRALVEYGSPGSVEAFIETELRAARAQLETLDACAPYLKEGETPAECIERNRGDIQALLTLLAKEKAQRETPIEALRAIAFQDYTIPTGIARRALAAVQEAEAPASPKEQFCTMDPNTCNRPPCAWPRCREEAQEMGFTSAAPASRRPPQEAQG